MEVNRKLAKRVIAVEGDLVVGRNGYTAKVVPKGLCAHIECEFDRCTQTKMDICACLEFVHQERVFEC